MEEPSRLSKINDDDKAVLVYRVYDDGERKELHSIEAVSEDKPELRKLLCENEIGKLEESSEDFLNGVVDEYVNENTDLPYPRGTHLCVVKTYKELKDEIMLKVEDEIKALDNTFNAVIY